MRRNFQQSAYFNPSIVTDDEGRAHVSFTLPDSLTTYRIMAVSVARDDRYGFAEARITTSRPLMARPAFPRILRAGDQIEAGVIVTSKGLPKAHVSVKIETTGIDLASSPQREIDLEPGQSMEVVYPLRATTVGTAKLRFTVQGGGERDSVEFGKRIEAPTALQAVSTTSPCSRKTRGNCLSALEWRLRSGSGNRE